jgi:hypothetical protein
MVIGRIDRDAVGDGIGLVIGILVGVVIVAMTPIVFGLPLAIVTWLCVSFTGGTAYAVAVSTINDRNVSGAGISAAIAAVLVGLVLALFARQVVGGILIVLTVVLAMAVYAGVESGLAKNMKKNRVSRRSAFTLGAFIVILGVLFSAYIGERFYDFSLLY